MLGVLTGFAIIAAIIAVGYVVGRIGLLGPDARPILARLVFFVLAPSLLFTILADAEVGQLFSPLLVVSLLAAATSFAVYGLVARLLWHRGVAETVIGALSAGYVNGNNIGIPVAVYVLGDPAYVAPVILVQLLLFAPLGLAVLDAAQQGRVSVGRLATGPLRNPIIIGSALGLLVALLDVTPPEAFMEPFRIIGGAAVPLMLLSYGISLHGQKVLEQGSDRRDAVLASAVKLLLMPAVAWTAGVLLFDLDHQELFVVVALAALPTAQNVFNYAQRYRRGETLARDAIFVTTIGSLPVLLGVAAVLR